MLVLPVGLDALLMLHVVVLSRLLRWCQMVLGYIRRSDRVGLGAGLLVEGMVDVGLIEHNVLIGSYISSLY